MGRCVTLSVLVFLLAFLVIGSVAAEVELEQGNSSTTTREEQSSPAPPPVPEPTPELAAPPVVAPSPEIVPPAKEESVPLPTPSVPTPPPATGPTQTSIEVPEDPCLPGLYKDWLEMSLDSQERQHRDSFATCRIIIDKSSFQLVVEGVRKDDTIEEVYRTHVGLGDVNSPTPDGNFVINHIYCYPDVVFFDASGEKVPGLYNGFFAPLLLCDDPKHCKRFRDMGIHGFQGAAARMHNVSVSSTATYGGVSAGCIRVPDPCRLKTELIRLVGIGPLKRNDRGTYHWLAKPVEVVIQGGYPGTDDQTTLVSMFQQGIEQVHDGLKNLFGILDR